MARSENLQKQISVMDRIARAMAELPDERVTSRVVTWFMDEYIPDEPPIPDGPQDHAADSGSKEQ